MTHQTTAARESAFGNECNSPPTLRSWRSLASAGLAAVDDVCSRLTPTWVRDAPGLLVLALHALCATRAQLRNAELAPGQTVCVEDLRSLVRAVLDAGYRIVSPEDVMAGLESGGRYAMLTFDDGYFNNVLALPVLEEFDVPATFFIASSYVLQGKSFWWDALCRELAHADASAGERKFELTRLKELPAGAIQTELQRRFGADALLPRGDADRPFTPAELAGFARNRHVHIGNHTADHAILTRCTPAEARSQIEQCQEALRAITGRIPVAIAYPNGNHSQHVVAQAQAAGLSLGFTVHPSKNSEVVPGESAAMRLGRFYFHASPDAASEFHRCCAGFLPGRLVRSMLQRG